MKNLWPLFVCLMLFIACSAAVNLGKIVFIKFYAWLGKKFFSICSDCGCILTHGMVWEGEDGRVLCHDCCVKNAELVMSKIKHELKKNL